MNKITKIPRFCANSGLFLALTLAQLSLMPDESHAKINNELYSSEQTHGVETIEVDSFQVYVSPSMGTAVMSGNGSIEASVRPAMQLRAGVLLTDQILLTVGVVKRSTGLYNPVTLGTGNAPGALDFFSGTLFSYDQTAADLGVNFFMLGREKRFRPFIGGSMGYRWNTLNYTSEALATLGGNSGFDYSRPYTIRQVFGSANIGAELAISRNVVVTTQFNVEGVFGAKGSDNNSGPSLYDPTKARIADSVAKIMAYSMTLGMGLYF
jgi:hypothetical protein